MVVSSQAIADRGRLRREATCFLQVSACHMAAIALLSSLSFSPIDLFAYLWPSQATATQAFAFISSAWSVFLWKSDLLTHCLRVLVKCPLSQSWAVGSWNLTHFPMPVSLPGLFFSILHYYIFYFLLLPFPLKCTFHEGMDFFLICSFLNPWFLGWCSTVITK